MTKLKDLIESHSLVCNEWVYERKKDSKQLTDICKILNYDTTSTDEQKMRKIEYIIFNIQYRKDVLSQIKK